MSLQVQMIGTGSAFAKHHFNNNALLFSPSFTLLIDCGITAPLALHKLEHSLDIIDGVLITHLHADHTGGLEEIGFRMKYQHQRKLNLYIEESLLSPLWEHTLKGGMEDDSHQTIHDFFNVTILHVGEPHQIAEGLTVTLFDTNHVPGKPSFSLLFNETFFYSADCTFHPELLTQLYDQGVRTFFHECQLRPPAVVHTGLDELLTLPQQLQQHIYLMHYDDDHETFLGSQGAMTFLEQGKRYAINA